MNNQASTLHTSTYPIFPFFSHTPQMLHFYSWRELSKFKASVTIPSPSSDVAWLLLVNPTSSSPTPLPSSTINSIVWDTDNRSVTSPCSNSYLPQVKVKVKSLSHVRLFATPWTVGRQAPLSMGFSRQEYWSGLPFPSPGDLPDPGIESGSLALQADTLTSEPPGKPLNSPINHNTQSPKTSTRVKAY